MYLKALQAHGSVTRIEYGGYVTRVKYGPLATEDEKGRPQLVTSDWPLMVKNRSMQAVRDAHFFVSYARREEKASDVNVATHLLLDALGGEVDAAIVISNDSDLRLPLRDVRQRIPLGTVNPSPSPLAGWLKGSQGEGVGDHWWLQLAASDFEAHQLPDPCATHAKPAPW